jgi:hypothetical protein
MQPMNAPASPARLYCTLVGAALVIAGVIGFFASSSFDTGAENVAANTGEALGFLGVNGWHNLVHLGLGLAALAVAGSASAARTYCLAVGLLYVVLAVWGLADGDGIILGLIPLDDEDNVLHLILGLTGLGAGAATAVATKPKRERPKREKAKAEQAKPDKVKPAKATPAKPDEPKPSKDPPQEPNPKT